MIKPDDANWQTDPNVHEWCRARDIVEFFIAYKQRARVTAFLERYEGPRDHDAIRDAFRRYAPDISA